MSAEQFGAVRRALSVIPAEDRDLWVRMGMAVKSELGDAGFEVWDSWSKGASNYNPKDTVTVWRSIGEVGKVTIGSLFHEAKQRGFEFSGHNGLSEFDRERLRRDREARTAEEQKRQEARQGDARTRAQAIWSEAKEINESHPYLQRKGIKAHGTRLVKAEVVRQRARWDAFDLSGDLLVVPMRDASGTLHCLQFIAADGERRYLLHARKTGYFEIGRPAGVLYVTEGFATGASVHEATGQAVAVAFDAGGLKHVARELHAKFPELQLVIAGDHDASGTGQRDAVDAARSVGALVALPEKEDDDWNDVAQREGHEAVRRGLDAARAPEVGEWVTTAPQASTPPSRAIRNGRILNRWLLRQSLRLTRSTHYPEHSRRSSPSSSARPRLPDPRRSPLSRSLARAW
jgi:putative DNA primase/helicase